MKYATVIGSRNITKDEFDLLRYISNELSYANFILRSGGADGSDSAINHLHNVEIIVPWNGFNGLKHDGKRVFAFESLPDRTAAINRAKQIHPAPDRLTNVTIKMHARNIYQIIGPKGANGVKSDFVIYCADEENGEPKGGTRTAVMYARELDIPTYNIRNKENLKGVLIRIGGEKYE